MRAVVGLTFMILLSGCILPSEKPEPTAVERGCPGGHVSGRVLDVSGSPIHGVYVGYHHSENSVDMQDTDAQGCWNFFRVHFYEGNHISFDKNGYVSQRIELYPEPVELYWDVKLRPTR